jgi:hypothetical protein
MVTPLAVHRPGRTIGAPEVVLTRLVQLGSPAADGVLDGGAGIGGGAPVVEVVVALPQADSTATRTKAESAEPSLSMLPSVRCRSGRL